MRSTYRRLRNAQDRADVGTHTIQTSGEAWLTGEAVFTQDYHTHTYQVVPCGDGPWDGKFNIEISNDNINYTCIYSSPTIDTATGVAYSDNWGFAYARAVLTGSAGEFLINERHLA